MKTFVSLVIGFLFLQITTVQMVPQEESAESDDLGPEERAAKGDLVSSNEKVAEGETAVAAGDKLFSTRFLEFNTVCGSYCMDVYSPFCAINDAGYHRTFKNRCSMRWYNKCSDEPTYYYKHRGQCNFVPSHVLPCAYEWCKQK